MACLPLGMEIIEFAQSRDNLIFQYRIHRYKIDQVQFPVDDFEGYKLQPVRDDRGRNHDLHVPKKKSHQTSLSKTTSIFPSPAT